MSTIVVDKLQKGDVWIPCICMDAGYMSKFSEFTLIRYEIANAQNTLHRGYCRYCNRPHTHIPVWNSKWDGNPTIAQHIRSCTVANCNLQQGMNHTIVSSQLPSQDPSVSSLHNNLCNTCNVSYQSNHIGFTWRVTNESATICERRACTSPGCNRNETNGHNWNTTRIEHIGPTPTHIQIIWSNDLSAGFNPALPAGAQHRTTRVCGRCNRLNPNVGANPVSANHTMGGWSGWHPHAFHGCERRKTCSVCGYQQMQLIAHSYSGNNCTRCGLTNAPTCWRTGAHTPGTFGSWGPNWAHPDTIHSRVQFCTSCGSGYREDIGNHNYTVTVTTAGAPAGTRYCNVCGTCNNHWNNHPWRNNGENEARAGTCGTPTCPRPAPSQFRAHQWTTTWQKSNTEHWQLCSTAGCGAQRNRGVHDFGTWFFWNQNDDVCQRRFESCLCGQPTAVDAQGHRLERPHLYDANDKCTRTNCTWSKDIIVVEPEWCPYCNNEGCPDCQGGAV